MKVASNQVRNAFGWEEWTPSAEDIKILRDAENLKDSLWEDHTEEPPGLLQEPTGEPSSLSAPPRLPPELQQPRRDYWRFTEMGVTRVHVQPRSELYVPQPHECEGFDHDDLAEQRRTYRNEAVEQPADDQVPSTSLQDLAQLSPRRP